MADAAAHILQQDVGPQLKSAARSQGAAAALAMAREFQTHAAQCSDEEEADRYKKRARTIREKIFAESLELYPDSAPS
eukprot:COSAG01_NODE_29979_length_625_cov_5.089354_1_plen_78_part_00